MKLRKEEGQFLRISPFQCSINFILKIKSTPPGAASYDPSNPPIKRRPGRPRKRPLQPNEMSNPNFHLDRSLPNVLGLDSLPEFFLRSPMGGDMGPGGLSSEWFLLFVVQRQTSIVSFCIMDVYREECGIIE